jgi:hypothetical protein
VLLRTVMRLKHAPQEAKAIKEHVESLAARLAEAERLLAAAPIAWTVAGSWARDYERFSLAASYAREADNGTVNAPSVAGQAPGTLSQESAQPGSGAGTSRVFAASEPAVRRMVSTRSGTAENPVLIARCATCGQFTEDAKAAIKAADSETECQHEWTPPTPPVKGTNMFCRKCGFFPGPDIPADSAASESADPERVEIARCPGCGRLPRPTLMGGMICDRCGGRDVPQPPPRVAVSAASESAPRNYQHYLRDDTTGRCVEWCPACRDAVSADAGACDFCGKRPAVRRIMNYGYPRNVCGACAPTQAGEML